MKRSITYVAFALAWAWGAPAQQFQRRATMVGGGSPNQGKCTIEVVVDGAAQVSIRGDQATLRNLNGRPAEWRRFECTGPLPSNPAEFRFAGVDGRGSQQLVRDPRQGGAAVVQIEDRDGGSEGYTFDVFWGGYNGGYGNSTADRYRNGYPPVGNRVPADRAVRICQDAVRQEAARRFHGRADIVDGRVDDNPGRNDWVIGRVDVAQDGMGPMRYSCSVDFDRGTVRSVSIDPWEGGWHHGNGNGNGPNRQFGAEEAISTCRTVAANRIRTSGWRDVQFDSIRMDNQPGRNDWVIGSAHAYRGHRLETVDFSCSVNFRNGDVRSVDVRRR